MEIREIREKLKIFFKDKYKGARGHKISKVQKIDSQDNTIMKYSFNLKCIFKNEPYDLDFILKLFLGEDGNQLAGKEYKERKEKLRQKIPTQKAYYHIESTEMFGYPFLILNSRVENYNKILKENESLSL